jgi:Anti-sigma factor NepR
MSEDKRLWRSPRLSDRELLLSIGQNLRHVYDATLREPLPEDIQALLEKISHSELKSVLKKG